MDSLNKVVNKVRKLEEFKSLKQQVQDATVMDKRAKADKIDYKISQQKKAMIR